jgi:hypothetical protein
MLYQEGEDMLSNINDLEELQRSYELLKILIKSMIYNPKTIEWE